MKDLVIQEAKIKVDMPYKVFEGSFKEFKEVGNLSFFGEDFYSEKKIENLKRELESGIPAYSFVLTPLVVGLTRSKEASKKFNILDYGGGVGSTYLELENSLEDINDIIYHIYDSKNTCELGEKYLNKRKNLKFYSDISDLGPQYDLMHLGSVIQYIENIQEEFNNFFDVGPQDKPRYILVSDAYVGSGKTYVTRADYYGFKHPFKIRSWKDLIGDFDFLGYKLTSKQSFIPKIQDKHQFYDMSNMPKQLRIKNTWHLLFEQKT